VPVARRLQSLGNLHQPSQIVLLADQLSRGAYDAVLDDYEAGRRVGPLLDGLVQGWAAFGAGRMSEAQAAFERTARTPGLQAFGFYHRGLALALAGDFEGAAAAFADQGNGFRLTRRGAVAHAQMLSQLERDGDALAMLDTVFGAATDPELEALRGDLAAGRSVPFTLLASPADGMAEVFYTVAAALQGEAADIQTLMYARVAEYLRPDHHDAALMAAELLSALGQDRLAIATYGAIPADAPAHLAAELGRAQALLAEDAVDEAVAVLRGAVAGFGGFVSPHVALGDALRRAERFAEAAEAYSAAVALIDTPEPRHWALFYSRAIAFERSKQWDRAEPDFRKALVLSPDEPQVLNYLGYSFLEMRRNLDEAMAMIERAVALRPDDGYIIDSLAWGFFLLGRYDEAVEPMERASLLMPVDPIVTDHLGDVYWAVGRGLEARFQWRRALSFEPEPDLAQRLRRKLEIGLDAVLAEEGAEPLQTRTVLAP
jgi:tetratricopeptide (TPR) repeat protein